MIVRELIAKLGFKVDDKQAKKFEKTIKGVQTALASFAVAKFNSSMSSMDDALENTMRQIGLIAGDKGIGLLEYAMTKRVVSSANEMATAVKSSLETLTDEKFTKDTIAFSEKIALATGRSIGEIQGLLDQAVSSKSLDGLKQLGLVTQNQIEIMQRANIEYSTANMKLKIHEMLLKKNASINKLVADADRKASAEKRKFWTALNDVGMLIGKTINPIIAKLAHWMTKLLKFFTDTKIGRFIIKVGALGSLFAVLVGAVASVVAVFGAIGFVFGKAFLVIMKISAAVAALVLIFEDLWSTFDDVSADTMFRDLINLAKELWTYIKEIGVSFADALKVPDWFKNTIGSLEIFKGSSAIAQAQQGSSTSTDNRKAEVTVNVQGGSAETVKEGVSGALKEAGFDSEHAQVHDTMSFGGI